MLFNLISNLIFILFLIIYFLSIKSMLLLLCLNIYSRLSQNNLIFLLIKILIGEIRKGIIYMIRLLIHRLFFIMKTKSRFLFNYCLF